MGKDHVERLSGTDSVCHDMPLVANPKQLSQSWATDMVDSTNQILREGLSSSQEISESALMCSTSTVAR